MIEQEIQEPTNKVLFWEPTILLYKWEIKNRPAKRSGVKSCVIIGSLFEEIRVRGIPSLERINRRGMFERSLRNAMVVEHRIPNESVMELLG